MLTATTQWSRFREDSTMRSGFRVCSANGHSRKSFANRTRKKTCCREALTFSVGVDPNLVVLWNTDADSCGRSLLECEFLSIFI